MTRARRLPAAAAALALLPALGGCISVFPKQAPAQLYRFDAAASEASGAAPAGVRVEVVAPPVAVSRASAGDQILAVTGAEAAFIAGARWVSPAAVLWDETVRRAFAARAGRVRLLSRNEIAGGRAFLRIDVPRFEVAYPAAGAIPSATVSLHALYTHRNGLFASEQTFTAAVPASADTVSAIVAAFDQAVERSTGALLAWADTHAGEAAADPPAPSAAPSTAGPQAALSTERSTTVTTTSPSPRRPPRP